MLNGLIYMVASDGRLLEMAERPYDSEAILQTLLADYPSLLAGEQVNTEAPRRWLLISREAGLASELNGVGRWSVDHLFLDQDAVPTIVEVKRSSDTRIRREVVGQLIEYAANAVLYWPIESVRALFESRCNNEGLDSDAELRNFTGGEDVDEFWRKVKTNLQAERIRLIFVADVIPQELRRMVEFLNKQMDPAEVLAIEVKQFVGEGIKTLVPRVIGWTADAEQKKSVGGRGEGHWDYESFVDALTRRNPQEAETATRIMGWSEKNMSYLWWGKGVQTGSCIPVLDWNGIGHTLFSIWTNGVVQIQFGVMKSRPPFTSEALRGEFARRLRQIPGATIPPDSTSRYPSFSLNSLREEAHFLSFISALDWAREVITRGPDAEHSETGA